MSVIGPELPFNIMNATSNSSKVLNFCNLLQKLRTLQIGFLWTLAMSVELEGRL